MLMQTAVPLSFFPKACDITLYKQYIKFQFIMSFNLKFLFVLVQREFESSRNGTSNLKLCLFLGK